MNKIRSLIRLIRPKQWVKNFFVMAPLLFSGKFHDLGALGDSLVATFYFCLASSFVYILNDIFDLERDRLHPTKSVKRPLANGELTINFAVFMMVSLLAVVSTSVYINPILLSVLLIYIIINCFYSFKLKHIPVVDIFIIAFGFVLRVVAGTVVLHENVSSWMLITTLCLALYLGSVKRRQELINSGPAARTVLEKYNLTLVDRYAEMSATAAIVFYSLFVLSHKQSLVYSIPLVLFGLFRYWYIVDVNTKGESPTDSLYEDKYLIITILVWVLFCLFAV